MTKSYISNRHIWCDPLSDKAKKTMGYIPSSDPGSEDGYVHNWVCSLWTEWYWSHEKNLRNQIFYWEDTPQGRVEKVYPELQQEWLDIFENEDTLAFWLMKLEYENDIT